MYLFLRHALTAQQDPQLCKFSVLRINQCTLAFKGMMLDADV